MDYLESTIDHRPSTIGREESTSAPCRVLRGALFTSNEQRATSNAFSAPLRLCGASLSLCLAFFLPKAALAGDWPSFGYDGANSRRTTELLVGSLGAGPWSRDLGAQVGASPIVSGDRVFVADRQGNVHALNLRTGAVIWSKKIGQGIESTPLVRGERLVVATKEGKVFGLWASDGSVIWTHDAKSTVVSSLQTDGRKVYVATGFPGDRLDAIDLFTGALIWKSETGQVLLSTPAVSGNRIVVGTTAGKYLALDPTSGSSVYTFSTSGGVFRSSATISAGLFFAVPGNVDRNVYRVNLSSGLGEGATDLNTPGGHLAPSRGQGAGGRGQATESDPTPVAPDAFSVGYEEAIRTGAFNSSDLGASRNAFRRAPALAATQYNFVSSPATDGSFVYVVSGVGTQHLMAYDVSSPAVRWAVDMGAPGDQGFSPTPALTSNQILAVGADGSLKRIQNQLVTPPSDYAAQVLQTVSLGGEITSSPVFANGWVLAARTDGRIYGYPTGNDGPTAPSVSSFSPNTGQELPARDMCDAVRCASITLSWPAATDALTGAPNLKYIVEIDDDSSLDEADSGHETKTFTGTPQWILENKPLSGSTRWWRLRVEDAHGAQSPWSATATFNIIGLPVPGAVVDLKAVPGTGSIAVNWNAGVGETPAKYQVRLGDQSPVDVAAAATTHTFTGLTPGVPHSICVTALNGDNVASDAVCVNAAASGPAVASGFKPDGSTPGTTPDATPPPAPQPEPVADSQQLEEALDDSETGDTIELGEGEFEGMFVVPEGVSLVGAGPSRTILRSKPGDPAALVLKDGSSARMLTATGGLAGVIIDGNAALQNAIVSANGRGIEIRTTFDVQHSTFDDHTVRLINLTIADNLDDAIYLEIVAAGFSPRLDIRNSIIANNGGFALRCMAGRATVTYSNVHSNEAGFAAGCTVENAGVDISSADATDPSVRKAFLDLGLLSLDPLFEAQDSDTFHLSPESPSIDAGDPADDFSLEPEPNGGRINQGAYGNTPEARSTFDDRRSSGGCGCSHIGAPSPFNGGHLLPFLILLAMVLTGRRKNLGHRGHKRHTP